MYVSRSCHVMNWHSNAWCDKYRREWYVRYGMVLHCIVFDRIVLYCIVLYCIVLYCIVLYCIVLYCIVLLSRVLSCIGLYCVLCIAFGSGMVQQVWYVIVCVVACSVRAAALFRTSLFGSIISSVIV